MPITHFDNLGQYGAIDDVEPYTLPREAWSDSRNVRFVNMGVEKMTGQENVFGTPLAAPYFAIPNVDAGTAFWFYASLTGLFTTDGTNHYDVNHIDGTTATYNATSQINWNGGHLGGGVVVLNNGVDAPVAWDGSSISDRFDLLANWPSGMVARTLRPFKQFLFAGDINESGDRNGTLLRWSDAAAPGSVPGSWDYTDLSTKSGRTEIPQGGYIVDFQQLRDYLMIYKENAVWSGQFTGGNNVFAFRKVFEQLGILSRRCAKEFFGKHFVVSGDDVIIHDGVTHEQVLESRWRKWLFNNIDGSVYDRTFVTVNHNKNEVWICFPETGETLPNLALIWNWKENTTYVRELPQGTAHIAWGIVDSGEDATIDGQTGTIDDWVGIIDEQSYTGAKRYLFMCDQARSLFHRGDQTEQFAGSDMTAYVRREALPLGRETREGVKFDVTNYKYIKEIWPTFEGTVGGVVNIYVGTQRFLGDSISWSGPRPFTIGTDRKVNLRASGRIISIRFESTTNITWRLLSYAVHWMKGGTR